MPVTINIAHPRYAVAQALQISLNYRNFNNINIYSNQQQLLSESNETDINLVDTKLIMPFIEQQKGQHQFTLLVSFETDPHIAEALYAGASSFINLANGPGQFVMQVELIAEKKLDTNSEIIRNFLREHQTQPVVSEEEYGLTKKEIQILKMMRDGKHLKLIAYDTDTTYETVRTHVKRIYKKLGVMSASEAVIKAFKMKL